MKVHVSALKHGVIADPELFAVLEGMRRDKKNKGGHIRFVALEGLAKTTRLEDATDAELEAAYNAIAN